MDSTISQEKIGDFRRFLLENERCEATIQKYSRDIRIFSDYVTNRELTKQLVLDYKADLLKKYAVTGANTKIASLNTFFRYLEREDLCVRQFHVQRKVYCSEDREMTKKDYAKLLSVSEKKNKRLNLLIQTLCATGIRVSELAYITVEAVRRGEATLSCKGKTRTVFLVPQLQKKLRQYIASVGLKQGPVFVTRTGRPVDRSNIWRDMKKLSEKARVSGKKVFPHNLRHLFAKTFYSMHRDIAKLSDILGHTNINTTRIYIISSGAEHRRQMESMHLIL